VTTPNRIDVPAIVISRLPGEEPEVRAVAIGAADFIRKPETNSILLARVSKVMKGELVAGC
jgi:DNA-binding response OmpR family regulator